MDKFLHCGRYKLPLTGAQSRPYVMGIVNATPDSFSDGSLAASNLNYLLDRAEAMINAGVDILDIGGESTRPGAPFVDVDTELQRVMPLIYALQDCGVPLSIDTNKPEVMRQAQIAGIDMINDVNGFRAKGALEVVKQGDCALCVMHMQKTPETMQQQPEYDDVIIEISDFFAERIAAMEQHSIAKNRLILDVGFGFGKTLPHNLALLKHQKLFAERFSLPVLAGLSRKSMLGAITGKPVELRLAASLGAALTAVVNGAHVVRVHDVAETVDALKVWDATRKAET